MWRAMSLVTIWLMSVTAGHAQDDGDVRRGQALAQRVCAQCHAVRKSQIDSPNPDAPTFPVIAQVPGMTALALTVALQNSHNLMPDLVIEPQERRDVIAYILSLRPAN
jgi:cytochrome c